MLARAAADNDALAEEVGLAETCEVIDLSMDELIHVATQRALRVLRPDLGGWRTTSEQVDLTPSEKKLLATLTALSMDGIAIGFRAAKERYENTE